MLSPEHERYRPVHQIILSQAVAGEAIAIRHLARMICLSKDLDERLELVPSSRGPMVRLGVSGFRSAIVGRRDGWPGIEAREA